ncbi:MAG TPA: BsuBI/PstI family type II restriction endonuclease [bacterium]|jgi:hypothetical protein|nr:BsuBI/PstI family type II restriction endonuclease [bacterium]
MIDVPKLETIRKRLPEIFPEGIEFRNYLVRDMAVSTVYVMFYANAIEGEDQWIRPSQVTDMTDSQAMKIDTSSRLAWVKKILSSNKKKPAKAWYATNTREPIRDETIRQGFAAIGAIVERQGLPTTSAKPKYALKKEFAALFSESLSGEALQAALSAWREKYLSKAALTRVLMIRQGSTLSTDSIVVNLPNRETKVLSPGESSAIAKGVIEDFASRFLVRPAVLWLSEPGNKVVVKEDAQAKKLGIQIDPSKNLPDIMLVDVGGEAGEVLFVFVEVVSTDGPISATRKKALLDIGLAAGFKEDQIAFVTAFRDRSAPAYKKLVSDLAWGSFVWFLSEPEHIVQLHGTKTDVLSNLRKTK